MKQKELYAAPETEVLELRLEGNILIVSGEGDIPSMTPDDGHDFD